MKMQKLDSKQVPQVIILGVLTAGVLGYGAMQFFGGSGGGSAPPPAKKSGGDTLAVAKKDEPTPPTPPPGNIPGLSLPGQYNPDPFKPAFAQTVIKPAVSKPATPPKPVASATPKEPEMKRGPLLPPDGRLAMGLPTTTPLPTAPPPPAAPVRPAVVVTGTSLVPGADTAIVEMGQEHRVVQVVDLLTPDYRVKKIEMDGIVLVGKKDRFFVGKGAKNKAERADAGGLKTPPAVAQPGVLRAGPQ